MHKIRLIFWGILCLVMLGLLGIPSQKALAADTSIAINTSTFGPSVDGKAPYDSDDTAGHDSNGTNGIVRSFDDIIIPVNLQFATDKVPYTLTFKLTGSIDNGMASKHVLNAAYDKSWGGTYDYDSNSSTFSRTVSFEVTDTNNGAWSQSVPIHVYGASNGTVLTPKLSVSLVSMTKDGTTTALSGTQDLTPAAGAVNHASFKVSSVTSVGVTLPNYYKGLPTFNDYTHATGTNQKNALIGNLSYAVGLKPISGRSNSYLGAAYPDPGTPITVYLDGNTTLNGTNVNAMSTTGIQTFQYGHNRQALTTMPAFAALYPNTNNVAVDNYVPYSSAAEAENLYGNAANLINYVTDSGAVTPNANETSFTFSDWYTSDTFPNIPESYAGVDPVNYYANETKSFISASARMILPLDAYKSGQQLSFKISNGGLSYTSGGQAVTASADDTNIIDGDIYSDFVQYDYQPTAKLGSVTITQNYDDLDEVKLGTDTWNSDSDEALYFGQQFFGWTHFALYNYDAQGGAYLMSLWNPAESAYDSSRQPYLKDDFTPAGTSLDPTFSYGVAISSSYSLTAMKSKNMDSYTWYSTAAQAEAHGKISAVRASITNIIAKGNQFNMFVPRKVITTTAGTKTASGDPYISISRTKTYFDSSHSAAYTLESPYSQFNYTPASYATNGTFTDASGSYQTKIGSSIKNYTSVRPGATALIEPYLVRLKEFQSDKSGYGSADTAKISVTPKIEALDDTDIDATKVTLTLPTGVNYQPGTAKLGGATVSPTLSTDDSGQTTLIFDLANPQVGNNGPITFDVAFSQSELAFDSYGQASPKITGLIESDKDQSVQALRSASLTLSVAKAYEIAVEKAGHGGTGTGSSVIERHTPFNYSVKFRNDYADAVSDVNILDKLPQDGVNGSHFSGNYLLNQVTGASDGAQIWYTTSDKYKASDTKSVVTDNAVSEPNTIYKAIQNGDSDWTAFSPGTAVNKAVTAIFYHMPSLDIGVGSAFTVDLSPGTGDNANVSGGCLQQHTDCE